MTTEQKNMELMQTLDDAWNAQDWDTFDKRHKPNVVVRWPAQPPTHGRHDHRGEGVQVVQRRDQAAAAGSEGRWLRPLATGRVVDHSAPRDRILRVARAETVEVGGGEAGVDHPEWLEQPLAQEHL